MQIRPVLKLKNFVKKFYCQALVLLITLASTQFLVAEEDCPTLLTEPDELKKFGKQRVQAIKGWDKLITWTLSPKNKNFILKMPEEVEEFSHTDESLVSFNNNYGYFSAQHPILGIVTSSDRDIKTTSCLLAAINEVIKNPKQRTFSEEEILAKVMAYRTLEKGTEIVGPNQVVYVVDRVINLWRGMPAFGLIPKESKEVPPILLFRGTDLNLTSEKGWASVLSDLDTTGPGHETFIRARDEIHDWLVTMKKNHLPARVIGFSLGGVFVLYTLIYESEQVNLGVPSVAFNPPGVTKELLFLWNDLRVKPPHITFVNQGDFISQVGFFFGEVWEVTLAQPMNVIAAHVTMISAQPKFFLRAVDTLRENESRTK